MRISGGRERKRHRLQAEGTGFEMEGTGPSSRAEMGIIVLAGWTIVSGGRDLEALISMRRERR